MNDFILKKLVIIFDFSCTELIPKFLSRDTELRVVHPPPSPPFAPRATNIICRWSLISCNLKAYYYFLCGINQAMKNFNVCLRFSTIQIFI